MSVYYNPFDDGAAAGTCNLLAPGEFALCMSARVQHYLHAMNCNRPSSRCRNGFSLVELAVVVIIIGVLAAFGIPRLPKSFERSKAAEAFEYLAAVRSSQERYQAQHGAYADELTYLDVQLPLPKYFVIHKHGFHEGESGSFEDSWKLRLERTGASSGYGKYNITFTEDGYDPDASSIEAFPEINPMGG